jgi:DNA processing protein
MPDPSLPGRRDRPPAAGPIREYRPITYFQLVARFGSAEAAIDAIPDLAARGGGRAPRLVPKSQIEREMEEVERLGARYIFLGRPPYPPLLAELETAPPALIVKGHVSLLERPVVALVGARNASAAACRYARVLAQGVGAGGAVVVSGLARGIDTAAHDGALETGTIAVIAGGPRHLLSARKRGAAARDRRARPARRRAAPGVEPRRAISPIATGSSPASRPARS